MNDMRYYVEKAGKPDFASMTPEARANYEACLKDDRLTAAEFNVSEWTYIEPAVGICSCGDGSGK